MALIEAEGLSKWYLLRGHSGLAGPMYERLSAVLGKVGITLPPFRPDNGLWALKDVSFTADRGEVLGVIGPNGAGKTTLLKILGRVTIPTEGRVRGRGRVVSLLELGMGFQAHLTARENIYLNTGLHGIPRREVEKRIDEILAFAELENFADAPVKRFSSGMYVRLAFSVAINMEPDILLADEVLAVGDIAFQQRCVERVSELADRGSLVLFVSHDMAAITRLCKRVLWLEKGEIVKVGPADEIVAEYEERSMSGAMAPQRKGRAVASNAVVTLKSVEFLSEEMRPAAAIRDSAPLIFRYNVEVARAPMVLRCGLAVSSMRRGRTLLFRSIQPPDVTIETPGTYSVVARIDAHNLNTGDYVAKCSVVAQVDDQMYPLAQDNAATFKIFATDETLGNANDPFAGLAQPGLMLPRVDWSLTQPIGERAPRKRERTKLKVVQ